MAKVTVWETPKAGSLANLVQKQRPLPPLSAGHVRVQIHAVGLNFADIFALTGLYSATPEGAFTPGLEFAGTVIDTGTDSGNIDSAFQVGDRVMGVTRFGGYCSIIDSEPDYLIPLPDDWSFAEGAAFPAQTLTAWYRSRLAGHETGDTARR